MSGVRILAIVLIVAGALVLAYGGFSYTREEEVADIGPFEMTAETRERVPLPPILGGIALAAGLVLLFTSGRKISG